MIRAATAADRAAIVALHLASWQDSYGIELPGEVLADVLPGYLAEKWAVRTFGPTERTFVAVAEGRMVGFVCALTDRTPPLIDNLHVHPEVRSGGSGGRLLGAVLADLAAAGHDAAELTVLARNVGSHRFYLAQGWADLGAETDLLVGRPVEVRRMRFELG
jgi:GNAT superfamily N-acetyltransferase